MTAVVDLGECIRDAKERMGYKKVILGGWSGGGSLALFYQRQAVCATVTCTPAGDPPNLQEEQLIPADGMMLLAAHLDSRCPVTMAVTPARPEQVRRRHMVEVSGGRVTRVEHYPERTGLTLAAMALFVFEMEFLRAGATDGAVRSLRDLIEPALARGIPIHAYPFGGFWEDVRDLEKRGDRQPQPARRRAVHAPRVRRHRARDRPGPARHV